MRALLFGAGGSIGSEVRARLRAAGHELVMFARDPAKLEPLAEHESARRGDIGDSDTVRAAVAGVDAVVSVLGPTSNAADQVTLFEGFARTLVDAMRANGIRRLVAISGAACTLPGERKRFGARVASGFVRLLVRNVVEAKQREVDVIAASDLDWVAPRPPRVMEEPATGSYRVGPAATGMRITRGDLADFIVAQLTDDTFLRQAPFVSN
jgi:putative NADH-flavin reductase